LLRLSDSRLANDIALGALALACAFGGLVVWPLYRWRQPQRVTRIRWLKGIFVFHVVGALVSGAYVAWAHLAEIGDAYMTGVFFYIVGTLSLTASAVVQLTGALATRRWSRIARG
jgi:hypothetical protein